MGELYLYLLFYIAPKFNDLIIYSIQNKEDGVYFYPEFYLNHFYVSDITSQPRKTVTTINTVHIQHTTQTSNKGL